MWEWPQEVYETYSLRTSEIAGDIETPALPLPKSLYGRRTTCSSSTVRKRVWPGLFLVVRSASIQVLQSQKFAQLTGRYYITFLGVSHAPFKTIRQTKPTSPTLTWKQEKPDEFPWGLSLPLFFTQMPLSDVIRSITLSVFVVMHSAPPLPPPKRSHNNGVRNLQWNQEDFTFFGTTLSQVAFQFAILCPSSNSFLSLFFFHFGCFSIVTPRVLKSMSFISFPF